MMKSENELVNQTFFKHALNPILILDSDGIVIRANKAACELIGKTLEDLLGKAIWDAIYELSSAKAFENWKRLPKENYQEGTFKFINNKNQMLHTEYRAIGNITQDRHMLILRDITARVGMATELAHTEARYRHLTSIYPVGIFHTDIQGNNIYINDKASEIMGMSFEDALGDGWANNLHPDDGWVKSFWHNAVNSKERINIEYRFLHKDGTAVWVKGQSVPEYDAAGELIGYVGTLTDITKLHEAEEQIRLNQIEIAHYSRVNSLGELASGIAHELNQPLTAIANYANGCLRRLAKNATPLPPEILSSIKNIAIQAERAGSIVNHLKHFLRKGEPKKSDCNVNQCLNNVLSILSGTVKNKNIELKFDLDLELPIIQADTISIEQVIINLITNAIEAMEDAETEHKTIILSSYKTNTDIYFKVADNGPGIPPEIEKGIFNPFVTTKVRGMGIGLSLSKNIIEMHNGKLSYLPAKPHGVIFEIKLPR